MKYKVNICCFTLHVDLVIFSKKIMASEPF